MVQVLLVFWCCVFGLKESSGVLVLKSFFVLLLFCSSVRFCGPSSVGVFGLKESIVVLVALFASHGWSFIVIVLGSIFVLLRFVLIVVHVVLFGSYCPCFQMGFSVIVIVLGSIFVLLRFVLIVQFLDSVLVLL